MRVTSLPPAPPVATAALLAAVVLMQLAAPSSARAERWQRPVSGEVTRSFAYARALPFVRGAHRGTDFAARPGEPVRAACRGVVVHAGPVPGQPGVVSLRCGDRRVSHLPLATVSVRAGVSVAAGALLGTVAAGHGHALHVGVRREADPLGYEDPMAWLGAPVRPFVAPPRARFRWRPPRPAPRVRTPLPVARPAVRAPLPAPAPAVRAPQPPPHAPLRVPAERGAPVVVWAGLALLACGAAGSTTARGRRRRRARPATRPAAPPPAASLRPARWPSTSRPPSTT